MQVAKIAHILFGKVPQRGCGIAEDSAQRSCLERRQESMSWETGFPDSVGMSEMGLRQLK